MDELKTLAGWAGWPVVVAFLLLGGGYAFWLLNNRIEHLKEINARLEKEPARDGSSSSDKCAVRVVSPPFGERVPHSFGVNGTFQHLPDGTAFWVCTADGQGKNRQYWPQGRAANVDKSNRTWHARVNWIDGNPGDLKEIVVMLVGENGHALIDYYIKAVEAINNWPVVSHLTRDMRECASHKVILGGKEVE